MKQDFQDKQKKKLIAQRNEILETLAGKNEQLRSLVQGIDSGDDVDIASDTIDRTLLNSPGEAYSARIWMCEPALERMACGSCEK